MSSPSFRPIQLDLAIEVQNDAVLFPDAAMSRRDKAAEALHGRLVRKKWSEGCTVGELDRQIVLG
jgi:hypothetical protein